MKKRTLSLLMALVLCLGLATPVFAGGDEDVWAPNYPTSINIKDGSGAVTSFDLDQTASGAGWSYDGDGSLTLDGFSGTQIYFNCKSVHPNLNLVLKGSNTISNSQDRPIKGDLNDGLTISGDGSLTVTGNLSSKMDLTVNSGTVTIDNPTCATWLGALTVNGGTLTLKNSRTQGYGPMDEENGYDVALALSAAIYEDPIAMKGGTLVLENKGLGSTKFESAWSWTAKATGTYTAYDKSGAVITKTLGDAGYSYVRITSTAPAPTFNAKTGEQLDKWALDLVNQAIDANLMPGHLKGADLRNNITRTQFADLAVTLYEAMSGVTVKAPAENPFTDTSDEAVLKAYAMGFTSGVSATEFGAKDPLTREAAATMLAAVYKRMDGKIDASGASAFADDANISGWAKDNVYFMAQHGIIAGVGSNKFDPKAMAQSQAALIIALRMFQNL